VSAHSVFKTAAAQEQVHGLYRDCLNAWPVAHEERHVATRCGDTFVVVSGPETAPAVVLLHGTMATAAMWHAETAALANTFRVLAVDIIGDAGFSAPARPPTSTDAHALWLQDVLDGFGRRAAHVVGLSLGGWLALDFATRCPARVSSLTLITPGGVADRNVLVWALPLLLLGSWGVRKIQQRILGPAPMEENEHQRRIALLSAAIFQGMRPRTERMRTISDDELAALAMPVRVLLGQDDVTMDSAQIARRIRQHVPRAQVTTLAGKRHFLGDQSAAIGEFLRGVSAAQAPA
jgi:pimeloyl-ACP methyl ester carboxylesterase